jgi:hypothetical protein
MPLFHVFGIGTCYVYDEQKFHEVPEFFHDLEPLHGSNLMMASIFLSKVSRKLEERKKRVQSAETMRGLVLIEQWRVGGGSNKPVAMWTMWTCFEMYGWSG